MTSIHLYNGTFYLTVGGSCVTHSPSTKYYRVNFLIDRVVNNFPIQDCLPAFNNTPDGYKSTAWSGFAITLLLVSNAPQEKSPVSILVELPERKVVLSNVIFLK